MSIEVVPNGKETAVEALARIKADAEKEISSEFEKKARDKLKDIYRKLDMAKKAVRNVENELKDALADIADGSSS